MSGFTKMFDSIVHSSIWQEDDSTRLVWITMLAFADQHGVIRASVGGLAHSARVSRPAAAAALAKFLAPDADSSDLVRAPEREGRRIEVVDGGWRLLNHGYYRELRGEAPLSMEPAAVRKRRQRVTGRDNVGHGVTERDGSVTDRDLSASASVSVSSSLAKETEIDGPDRIVAGGPPRLVVEQRFGETDQGYLNRQTNERVSLLAERWGFGKYRADVVSFLRGLPKREQIHAWVAELENHCAGEMGCKATPPEQVGYALSQFLLAGHEQFNAALFGGYVRRGASRQQLVREQQHIEREAAARKEREMEDESVLAGRRAAVERFEQEHPERYAELAALAETLVDPKQTRGRGILARAELVMLIRAEVGLEGAA